jgi:hypothetical protein
MKPRFDFYSVDRNDITNEVYLDLIIHRDYDTNPLRPVVKMWKGKQTKPFSNFYYSKGVANAEASIAKEKNYADARQGRKDDEKREREILKTLKPTLAVGDILVSSYGYDQTNKDFFQIVSVKGKTALVQEIGQHVEEDGYMSGRAMPNSSSKKGKPFKKLICLRSYDGTNAIESIKISECQRAYLWDGKPEYVSWYA